MYDETLGQIVGEVGERWLENRRNGFRSILQARSRIDTVPRGKVTHLGIVEREDDRLKFKMGARLEPVLSGDRDPFAIRKESICRPEVIWCGESKVRGLTDGREDVEVGKGGKDEDEDDCFYGGRRSTRRERSRDCTHCFGGLTETIRMRAARAQRGGRRTKIAGLLLDGERSKDGQDNLDDDEAGLVVVKGMGETGEWEKSFDRIFIGRLLSM